MYKQAPVPHKAACETPWDRISPTPTHFNRILVGAHAYVNLVWKALINFPLDPTFFSWISHTNSPRAEGIIRKCIGFSFSVPALTSRGHWALYCVYYVVWEKLSLAGQLNVNTTLDLNSPPLINGDLNNHKIHVRGIASLLHPVSYRTLVCGHLKSLFPQAQFPNRPGFIIIHRGVITLWWTCNVAKRDVTRRQWCPGGQNKLSRVPQFTPHYGL